MASNASKIAHEPDAGRLTRARGEKISAVEGLSLSPRMRRLLDQTEGKSGDERRALIRAQFAGKTGER